MSKRIKLLCLLFICCSSVIVGWRLATRSRAGNNSPLTTGQRGSMFDQIEEKAQRAKDGNEASIRELGDEIFNKLATADIPAHTLLEMKDRLLRAELRYRRNKKGCRESHIVKAINELAGKFAAPDYAKTSPLQVRALRVNLMFSVPSLVAPEANEKKKLKKRVGDKLDPHVSPLEAVFLTMLMIQQKMLNPVWQQTSAEFADSLSKHRSKGNGGERGHQLRVDNLNREKSHVMRRVVANKVKGLGAADMHELIAASLDTLGIDR